MLAIDYRVVIGQGLLSHPKSLDKETDEHVDTLDTKVQRSNWVIGSSKVIDSSPPHSQPFYHEERWHSSSASRQLMVMAMNRNFYKFAVGARVVYLSLGNINIKHGELSRYSSFS